MSGRVYDIVLHLLDHQIVDTDGALAGKVDDVELTVEPDGTATVTALLSGPGVLARRQGHRAYGPWRERREEQLDPDHRGRSRIPLREVRAIGTGIRVNRTRAALASFGTERWVRDHIVRHIPGARSGG